LQIYVAGRGVERGPPGRREIGAQELIDAGRGPALICARDDAPNDGLYHGSWGELDEPKLRPGQAEQWNPGPVAPPGQRGSQQRQTTDAVGTAQGDFQRDASAEAVADQVDAVQFQGVEEIDHSGSEEACVIAG